MQTGAAAAAAAVSVAGGGAARQHCIQHRRIPLPSADFTEKTPRGLRMLHWTVVSDIDERRTGSIGRSFEHDTNLSTRGTPRSQLYSLWHARGPRPSE